MIHINDLGIKTYEGFEVKNLDHFPSLEWGPNGGLSADLYYQGKKILNLFQAGEGGCAVAHMTEHGNMILGEVREAGLTFLRRRDPAYTNGKYSWLKEKTVKTFNDDDWEAVINSIEDRFEDIKIAAKTFTQGYKALAIMKNDYGQYATLNYRVHDITLKEVSDYMNQHNLHKKYNSLTIIRQSDNLKLY